MNDKIKLNFLVKSYTDGCKNYETNIYSKSYNSTATFENILKELYSMFSIYKEDFEMDGDNYSAYICNGNLFGIEYNFIGLEPDYSIFDYENIPIGLLEKQFQISKYKFEIILDLEIGDVVGRERGIVFFFHSKEKDLHHVPHIHCKYGSKELRVNLKTLEIIDTPFKNNKNNKIALEAIKNNQSELIKYWQSFVVNGETIKFKMRKSIKKKKGGQ